MKAPGSFVCNGEELALFRMGKVRRFAMEEPLPHRPRAPIPWLRYRERESSVATWLDI